MLYVGCYIDLKWRQVKSLSWTGQCESLRSDSSSELLFPTWEYRIKNGPGAAGTVAILTHWEILLCCNLNRLMHRLYISVSGGSLILLYPFRTPNILSKEKKMCVRLKKKHLNQQKSNCALKKKIKFILCTLYTAVNRAGKDRGDTHSNVYNWFVYDY